MAGVAGDIGTINASLHGVEARNFSEGIWQLKPNAGSIRPVERSIEFYASLGFSVKEPHSGRACGARLGVADRRKG